MKRVIILFVILVGFVLFFGFTDRADAPDSPNESVYPASNDSVIIWGSLVHTTEEACMNEYEGQCSFVQCSLGPTGNECDGYVKHWAPVTFGLQEKCETFTDAECTLEGDYWRAQ